VSYKPRTLFRLIEDINVSLFLPHIQRPFVWDEDQIRRLFDSLMRDYPIQTLLFWRTKDQIMARRFMPSVEWDADLSEYYEKTKSDQGVEKVFVLDGQQRLQSLFAVFNGAIKSSDGTNDLKAYFDVTAGNQLSDDGLLYRLEFRAEEKLPLPLYPLRNLLGVDAKKNSLKLAKELNDELNASLNDSGSARQDRQDRVRENCSQISSLLLEERHFWVEELDGVANEYPYKKILDIFVRVNSGGTKLDSSDLMFAAMKEGWGEIEQNVDSIVDILNDGRLSFDKTFALKCLVVAHGKGAELSPDSFASSEGEKLIAAIQADWPKAETAFQELRDFIANDLKLYADKVVRSYSSFVPLFDYLYHNPKPDEGNRVLMRGYYYKSQLFNWYGAQTDNIVNAMHNRLGKAVSSFPLKDVMDFFRVSRRSETELRLEHLANMRLRFIVLNLIYVERFGASPFNVCFKGNEPHVDHIYPQSQLKKVLSLTTEEINHIGNYRFVGATDNIRKSAELPASFFGRLKTKGVNVENHLLLPEFASDPMKLKFDVATYHDFRDRRIKKIIEIADPVVNPEKQ
jgi:Protein of unknown function DUF262